MSKSAQKTVALTGATGFLGQHLLDALVEAGYQVNALVRRPQKLRENVTWIMGDLSDMGALIDMCAGAESVIHVAGAIKGLTRSDFFEANRSGTLNVANAAKQADCPRFLHISSLAAREGNLSHYSASKAAAEDLFSQRKWPFEWCVIRPPGIYGPGDMETLELIRMINRGFMLAPGNRKNRASWIHVADLCSAILAVLDEFPVKQTLELDDGVGGYTHEEFCAAVGHILGKDPVLVTAPGFLVRTMGAASGFAARIRRRANIFTLPKARELLHSDWSVDSRHASRLKKWHPRYTLTSGLENAIDWYRQNGFL